MGVTRTPRRYINNVDAVAVVNTHILSTLYPILADATFFDKYENEYFTVPIALNL